MGAWNVVFLAFGYALGFLETYFLKNVLQNVQYKEYLFAICHIGLGSGLLLFNVLNLDISVLGSFYFGYGAAIKFGEKIKLHFQSKGKDVTLEEVKVDNVSPGEKVDEKEEDGNGDT